MTIFCCDVLYLGRDEFDNEMASASPREHHRATELLHCGQRHLLVPAEVLRGMRESTAVLTSDAGTEDSNIEQLSKTFVTTNTFEQFSSKVPCTSRRPGTLLSGLVVGTS